MVGFTFRGGKSLVHPEGGIGLVDVNVGEGIGLVPDSAGAELAAMVGKEQVALGEKEGERAGYRAGGGPVGVEAKMAGAIGGTASGEEFRGLVG